MYVMNRKEFEKIKARAYYYAIEIIKRANGFKGRATATFLAEQILLAKTQGELENAKLDFKSFMQDALNTVARFEEVE